MNQEKLEFYPKHPSNEKTHLIETTKMPCLKQTLPFKIDALYNEFNHDLAQSLNQYQDKRFKIEGIAIYIGPDIHHKPSIQISNQLGGICYALVIFPNEEFYQKVSIGDHVIVEANYLVFSNLFGIVMKNSELIKVSK